MSFVVQVVLKLLDSKVPEFTATFVGRLVWLLLGRLGAELGDSGDLMLRAVLSKLQQAETLSVVQSLLLVFAQLFSSRTTETLDFLSSVPDPTGKPALHFVLSEWCAKHYLFYGSYEQKVRYSPFSCFLFFLLSFFCCGIDATCLRRCLVQ